MRSYDDGSQRYVSHPPLSTIYQNQNEDIWRIFYRYLVYIESHNKPFLHPLSGHVMSIIRASEASLDAQALSLAVAVEGLMKLSFKDFKKPSQAVLDQVTKLAELIAESDLDDDFKRRITGMFGGMKSHRPKDLLHELVVMGDIRQNLVSTWGSLRNAQAHADSQDPEKIAQLLKKCQIVRTLFYELVFIVIGYEGLYTDYSTEDWPNRSNVRAIEK